MHFHSLDYVVFLIALLLVYWLLPRRWQNVLLLVTSYVFYGYLHPWYLLLIGFTSTVDWIAANGIRRNPERKKLFLTLTLVTNFSILVSFKYLNFLTGGHAIHVVHWLGFTWMTPQMVAAILPVGISFYTFQSASYVVDVYRGRLQAEKSLPDYLLFVSFFPQLVAGPIERAQNLLTQLTGDRRFHAGIARGALVLILWGYLKKMVIADNAALVANKIFALEDVPFPVLWVGVFAFGVQIYADFSAYTDIARGSARLLGFELMENFRHPYLAHSPIDFWRRWHISLSTWFRDYVYIPLGGNRCSPARQSWNLFIVFLLSGLWHGPSWNFVLWGGFHGILLVLWQWWEKAPAAVHPQRIPKVFRILLTFALVNIGWLMFREQNTEALGRALTLMPWDANAMDWRVAIYRLTLVLLVAWPLAVHPLLDWWLQRYHGTAQAQHFTGWKWVAAQAGLVAIFLVAILVAKAPASADFIYFQF